MEWYEAVEYVTPYVVKISTPRGSGTGFFVSASATTDICAIATAAHVVSDSNWWEEPIRLYHPQSGQSRILRHSDRSLHFEYDMDTAAILFSKGNLPFPAAPMPFTPEGKYFRVGNEIGWLGFPAMSPSSLCFFSGRVSLWQQDQGAYLVDGVTINGVSGGPAFTIPGNQQAVLVGVVSAYIPNLATGQTLPGLSVIRDVRQFQELARRFQSLDEAAEQQEPPRPPEGEHMPSRTGF